MKPRCDRCKEAYIDPATVGVIALRPSHNCAKTIKWIEPYYEQGIAPFWCPLKEKKDG